MLRQAIWYIDTYIHILCTMQLTSPSHGCTTTKGQVHICRQEKHALDIWATDADRLISTRDMIAIPPNSLIVMVLSKILFRNLISARGISTKTKCIQYRNDWKVNIAIPPSSTVQEQTAAALHGRAQREATSRAPPIVPTAQRRTHGPSSKRTGDLLVMCSLGRYVFSCFCLYQEVRESTQMPPMPRGWPHRTSSTIILAVVFLLTRQPTV